MEALIKIANHYIARIEDELYRARFENTAFTAQLSVLPQVGNLLDFRLASMAASQLGDVSFSNQVKVDNVIHFVGKDQIIEIHVVPVHNDFSGQELDPSDLY